MKLSKFANLVKNGGRCTVLHVAGSGIWLSTGTAIYRATELPDMEGSEQVRTVLDMTADAWKKVYLTEDWPESTILCHDQVAYIETRRGGGDAQYGLFLGLSSGKELGVWYRTEEARKAAYRMRRRREKTI